MFDHPVRNVMNKRNVLVGPPDTPVARAAQRMARKNVGAMLVVDDETLVGIFTERDVVFRVVAKGLDLRATRVADVMTRSPTTIDPGERFGYALCVMHERGFRHLPVVDRGRIVGILSARSAMDPELEEFVSEAERRKHLRASSRTALRRVTAAKR
jgi:CBS domain-containing protein